MSSLMRHLTNVYLRRLSGWLAGGMVLGAVCVLGQPPVSQVSTPANRAEEAYRAARALYHANTNSVEAAWQFGRTSFDRAEFADKEAERAALADEGISACRQALVTRPKNAAAHYYLGMNLAQLAKTKLMGALHLVKGMEKEFTAAAALDETFDHAGADRNLGMLYLEAPGWPMSIGSRRKARHHILKAVRLSPDYPENHLNLMEALIQWNDRAGIDQEAPILTNVMTTARTQLTGPMWESNWTDWDQRMGKIRTNLDQLPPQRGAPKLK